MNKHFIYSFDMKEKFKNKYRIGSARLQNWNYGWNAAYFITICTENKIHHFGSIKNGKMKFSENGKITQNIWRKIPNYFPYAKLGAFIIMPNHVHGIVIIDNMENDILNRRNVINDVSTTISVKKINDKKIKNGGITGNKNPMLHQNVSRIIRWFKGRCTFEIRKIHHQFKWQPRFYDHIIRNEKSYNIISMYIIKNPQKWDEDRFF